MWARVGISLVIWSAVAIVGLGFTGYGSLHAVCANPDPGGVCHYPPSAINLTGYVLLVVALVGSLATVGWVVRRRSGSRDIREGRATLRDGHSTLDGGGTSGRINPLA